MTGQPLLIFLAALPIVTYWIAKRRSAKHAFLAVGITFGAIVSPWALGLYSLYFWSPWGVVPGLLGLALTLIHGPPGFELAVSWGLVPPGVVSGASSNVVIESINGLVWAVVYGAIGFAIDRIRNRKSYDKSKGTGPV